MPADTIQRAVNYVLQSQVRDDELPPWPREQQGYYRTGPGAFKYQNESDARSSFALTAAGVTSLYHAARYDTSTIERSLDFIEDTQRLVSANWSDHYFYYYGHYYAVQAMFITGGARWDRYWKVTSRELLDSQHAEGRWLNRVGPGDLFGTAIACIVLQTPYRYLPILQR